MQDLAYLGSFSNVNAAFMMRKDAPAKTVEDMRHIETKVGCNSRLGQTYVNYALLKAYGGFKFQIICGYPGRWSSPWCSPGRGRRDLGRLEFLVAAARGSRRHVSAGDLSGLARHNELLDVPLMQELLADPKHKQVAEFL